MGKRNGFNRKGNSDSSVSAATKNKFMAPMLGREDIYFTQGTVSNAARYAEVVDKLRKYVAVDFSNQATVVARAMEDLKAPTFVKSDRPIQVYCADEGWTVETNNKRSVGSMKDNVPKSEDWEHKLIVKEYLEKYTFDKEGIKAWAENKGK